MGEIVTIEPVYLPVIERLARNRMQGKVDFKRTKRPAFDQNRDGLMGEFAVAQYFALDPLAYFKNTGSDGGIDIVVPGSTKTIQIKYRPKPGLDLLVPNNQPLKCDVAILTENNGDPLRVRLVGWTTRQDFDTHAERRRFRPELPMDYMLPRQRLRPIRDIWEVL